MRKLLVLIVLAWIPLCGQPLLVQTPGVGVQSSQKQEQQRNLTTRNPAGEQLGTKEFPLVVDTEGHKKTPSEAAEDKRKDDTKEYRDRWTFRLTVIGTVIGGILMLIGGGGVIAAVLTLRRMDRQLTEMQQARTQAAQHLSLTERPWVSPNVRIASPLTVDEDGVHITLRIEFNNVGKSPAVGVWATPVLYFGHDFIEERKRRCNDAVAHPINEFGEILFPNAVPPHVMNATLHAGPEDVRNASTLAGSYIGSYTAYIILCVAYRSTLDETARHCTGVIYHLSRIEPKTPDSIFTIPVGESVPIERLRLQSAFPYGPIAQ